MQKQHSGFTLVEVIVVLVLLGLLVGALAPFGVGMIERYKERKRLFEIMGVIKDLRGQALATMGDAEIAADKKDMVMSLRGTEVRRVTFDQEIGMKHPIMFNKYGLSNGGEIFVRLGRSYKVIVERLRGRVSLERAE